MGERETPTVPLGALGPSGEDSARRRDVSDRRGNVATNVSDWLAEQMERPEREPTSPADEERSKSGVVGQVRAASTKGIATGMLLDGRYRVGRVVGTGAFGLVFEATNLELDEKVALK